MYMRLVLFVSSFGLSLFLALLLFESQSLADSSLDDQIEEGLRDALALYQSTRGEAWIKATDPNERFEAIFNAYLLKKVIDEKQFEALFNAADEAFELEIDRIKGMGASPAPPRGLPFRPRPLHRGERGGLDGTSCRSCHFSGGPDGAGSGTSLTLFRGDGERFSQSTPRDAPALMGIGYLTLLATQMTRELQQQKQKAIQTARRVQESIRVALSAQGVRFGAITVTPHGEYNTKELRGVSEDLIIRPLGWKGRHYDLVAIADESLALHHGLQSDHRVESFKERSLTHLGVGPDWDRDEDGAIQELTGAHPAALAVYLSLLSVPLYAPPQRTSDAIDWARGRGWFQNIGCATCHIPSLRVKSEPLVIKALGKTPISVEINPFEAGQEPRLRRVDYSADAEGSLPRGVPLFLYSDLKRHDLGSELAETFDEKLPNGLVVNKQMWLTRPLWGLASSAPYLHDGRAQTVEEAILAHGGEATPSIQLYRSLSDEERGLLRLYLMSLGRPSTLLVE